METWMIYVISFGMLYVMFNIIGLVVFKKVILEQIRQWIFVGRGYCKIRINDLTRHQQEFFLKPKESSISISGFRYIVDPKKVRYIGKCAVYEYRKDVAEPIDPFKAELVGTDAEFLDGFLVKMKALARLAAIKELQFILILTIIAVVAALVAAGIGGYNYTMIDKLVKALI